MIAGFASKALNAFVGNDWSHDQGRDWVSPPKPE
jgi:hypothetical protein